MPQPGISLANKGSGQIHDSSSLILSNHDNKILDDNYSKVSSKPRTETKKKEKEPVVTTMAEADETISQRAILPHAHSSSRKRLTRNFTF